jgi:WD40 repeat protein
MQELAISPDGQLLAAAGHMMALQVWNLNSQKRVQTLRHDKWVTSLAFVRRGRLVTAEGLPIRRRWCAAVWDVTRLCTAYINTVTVYNLPGSRCRHGNDFNRMLDASTGMLLWTQPDQTAGSSRWTKVIVTAIMFSAGYC